MGSAAAGAISLLPPCYQLKPSLVGKKLRSVRGKEYCRNRPLVPVARLFGPAIFEAAKLKVLFLEVDKENQPRKLPRTYTLTHSDITAKLTLGISQSINKAQFQGWYNRFYRDEVVAEWRKVQGKMSLHVHCHISGGHFLLDFIAKLRYYIFRNELPVVLNAFVHGDIDLFDCHPELQDSMVWVYFHSNLPEFNRLECWGPLRDALNGSQHTAMDLEGAAGAVCPSRRPKNCPGNCNCCFPQKSSIPWAHEFDSRHGGTGISNLQQQNR